MLPVITKLKNNTSNVIGTIPYLLTKLVYYLYMVLAIFSAEIFVGVAWNNQNHWFDFNIIGSYFLIFSMNLLVGLFLLFLGFKYFGCKLNKKVIAIELVCLIGMIVASSYFPSHFSYTDSYYINNFGSNATFTYNLDITSRLQFLFTSINLLLFYYVSFTIIPKTMKYKLHQEYFYYFIILMCFIAIIYSFIVEEKEYSSLFLNLNTFPSGISSFLGTKNVFGTLLSFGIICLILLSYYKKKNIYFVFATLFLLELLITQNRTGIISSAFIYICYVVFALITDWKIKSRRYFFIAFTSTLIVTLLVLLFIPENGLSKIIKVNINEIFTRIVNNDGTFNSRVIIWKRIIALLLEYPIFFVFGVGNYQFNYASFFAADVYEVNIWQPHNSILMVMGEGGIIRLIIYLLFQLYLLYIISKKVIKEKNFDALLLFILLLGFYLRSISEPENFFSATWSSVIYTFLIAIPILSLNIDKNITNNFDISKTSFNLIAVFALFTPTLLCTGFISVRMYFALPTFILGIVLQFTFINLLRNKSYYKEVKYFILITDLFLLIPALIFKIIRLNNLATNIEFFFFSFIVNFLLLYYSSYFKLLKVEFNNWTILENKVDTHYIDYNYEK